MRCPDRLGRDRCTKPADHPGFHRKGLHIWGFTWPTPQWQRKAAADWERAHR